MRCHHSKLLRFEDKAVTNIAPKRCTVHVTQLPGGDVVGVNISSCNGDEAVVRSVEAAIRRSSPLPQPSNPDLFDRNLTLNLTLEREN